VEPVKFDSSNPIEFLKEPPREYRNEFMHPLTQAEEPRMEARSLASQPGEPGRKGAELSRASIPIRFDARSLSFMVPREVARDGKTTTLLLPMTNRTGSLQSRAESLGGGSGFRGESSGSGSRFPGHDSVPSFQDRGGSSTSSGATFHGGGSSSSSGGGFHGGGSSSGPSNASSSNSAGSSSAASSGSSSAGSHH
jgi:hypothetical protein